jgi:hypothetical protein
MKTIFERRMIKMTSARIIAEAVIRMDDDELDNIEGEMSLMELIQKGVVTFEVTKFQVVTEEGELEESEALSVENINQQVLELIKIIG